MKYCKRNFSHSSACNVTHLGFQYLSAGKMGEEKSFGRFKIFAAGGEILPALERARKWRVVLNEWRKSIGLPVIE